MPLATGAAVACPDRRVVNLQADGSAMYTLQSLWTQAREGLDVTTILFDNQSYAILNIELGRVGAGAGGAAAQSLLDLTNPSLDFVALGQGDGRRRHPTGDGRGAHRRTGTLVRRARAPSHRRAAAGAGSSPRGVRLGTLRKWPSGSITWS